MAEPTQPEKKLSPNTSSDLNSANSSFSIIDPNEPIKDDDDTKVDIPFAFLKGEHDLFVGFSVDGLAVLTNYRFYHQRCVRDHFINLPLGIISHVQTSGLVLFIFCKNGRSYSLAFNLKDIEKWEAQIKSKINQLDPEACFAFAHFSNFAQKKDIENSFSNGKTAPSTKPENIVVVDSEDVHCKDGTVTYHNGTNGDSEKAENGTEFQKPKTSASQRENTSEKLDNKDDLDGKSVSEIKLEEVNFYGEIYLHVAADYENSLVTKEARRMKFDLKNVWRISTFNELYMLCPSYPRQIITPINVSDTDLIEVAKYRRKKRIPAVVWRHPVHGRVIARCSQPSQGLWGYTSAEDQKLLAAIHEACLHGQDADKDSAPSLLIVDARSALAAWGNRFNVGGHEDVQCYGNCVIEFMNIANIHRVRDSLNAVSLLCATPDRLEWLVRLEETCWLSHISSIIRAALVIVKAIHDDWRPVLVHCSDGWDRTSQLTSLAQLLLDPYYRTIEGFQVLVEREWLEFGHKFADRCGHWNNEAAEQERSPVFLQWLDCVFQLQQQFPFDFEFNEQYLIRLVTHTYSGLFGDFFCNTDEQRRSHKLQIQTYSVWPALRGVKEFYNEFYCENKEVLRPSCQIRNLKFWSNMYLQKEAISYNTFKMLEFESQTHSKPSEDPSILKTSSPKEDIKPTKNDNPLETSDIPEIPDPKLGDSEPQDLNANTLTDGRSVSEFLKITDSKLGNLEPQKNPLEITLSNNGSVLEVPGIANPKLGEDPKMIPPSYSGSVLEIADPKDEDSDAKNNPNLMVQLSDSGSILEVPDEEDPGQASGGPLDLLSSVLPNLYSMYDSLCSLVPSFPFYSGEVESPKKESSCVWVIDSTRHEPEESPRVLDFDGLFFQEDFVSRMARKFREKNPECSCKHNCPPDLSESDS